MIAGDGTVAFTRPTAKFDGEMHTRVLMIAAPGKEAVAATSDEDTVRELALDRATGTLWILKSKDASQNLWKLLLAGGKLERVAGDPAYAIYGVAAGSVLVSYSSNVMRRPVTGGKSSDVADLNSQHVVGIVGDRLLLLGRQNHKLSSVSITAAAAAPGKRTELAIATDELTLSQPGDTAYLIARSAGAYEVRDAADVAVPPVLVTRGVRPTDVVRTGDRLVVLAAVDSNDDGKFGRLDETDVSRRIGGRSAPASPTSA